MQVTRYASGKSLAKLTAVSAAVCAALSMTGTARAAEIDTGNPDAVLRWDNTIRYNLGMRTQSQDKAILGNPNLDDGDRNFNKSSLVANRLDLLSEMDLVVDKKYGFRVSGAAWGDAAYNSLDNTSAATANTLVNGVPTPGALSSHTKRFAKGPSGELLDAFVFLNGELGDMPANVRAGRHTVFWGEGLYGASALHGISYGQYSLDLWKGYATPGVEAKELFRPRNSVTAQIQPSSTLTLSAQYFLAWESARYPEAGSYLTVNDALLEGGQSLVAGVNQRLLQGEVGKPKKSGDWGLSARWSPEWLEGTLGFYARRTADIQPQLAALPAAAGVPAAATVPQILGGFVGQYRAFYGRDIDILGLSLSKSIGGVSVGSELSWRHNMPLNSIAVNVLPTALANPAAGQLSLAQLAATDIPGARGNTMHAVVNALGVIPKTALFDTASYGAEMVFNRWINVTGNANSFKGSEAYIHGMNGGLTPFAAGGAANVDAVTKNYVGLGINFTPTWFQVFPSVDLSMPMNWSGGISGISAVTSGGARNNGNFSLGVAADVNSRYNFALRYIGFYGGYSTNAAGALAVSESVSASLSDRGHLMFTFKTTF